MFKKITIIRIRKPVNKDINRDLQWFSESLGLFGSRDKEKSCFRVFIELLKSTRSQKPTTSDEIAFRANLSRATVIHHINKLIEAGFIDAAKGGYILRVDNLETLVSEIKQDMNRYFLELEEMAKELDDELGLLKRKKGDNKVITEE